MPELRQNLITQEWVIIEKEKNMTPEDFKRGNEIKRYPQFLETCPFCPGNESRSPAEIYRIGDEKGWKIRVVPNKFAKLSKEGKLESFKHGLNTSVNGVGIHDVIIETPIHNLTTATMSAEQLKDVIQTCKDLFLETYKDKRVDYVIIFKNSGPASGTSIEHAHSQIVGFPITPFQISKRIEDYMKFFNYTGDCIFCKTMHDELTDRARIVSNTEHFVSFVPYAALSPFHIWLFPKRHSASFDDIQSDEIWDLATNLKTTMAKLYYGLDHPDFNYIIRSGKPSDKDQESMHWYIGIVPRVSMLSGFELGSSVFLNPLLPEMSAEFLRNVSIPK